MLHTHLPSCTAHNLDYKCVKIAKLTWGRDKLGPLHATVSKTSIFCFKGMAKIEAINQETEHCHYH